MPRVTHFEFQAEDPQRAERFFKDVFDWKFQKWNGGEMDYWVVTTGEKEPGINGGMVKKGSRFVQHTIEVESIDQYIDRIESAGGEVLFPKMAIPGVGWFTQFKDTEGNIFGLMQPDKEAK